MEVRTDCPLFVSQLHTLVVDKLIRTGIVDPMSVVNWLFAPEVTPQLTKLVLA